MVAFILLLYVFFFKVEGCLEFKKLPEKHQDH